MADVPIEKQIEAVRAVLSGYRVSAGHSALRAALKTLETLRDQPPPVKGTDS